MGKPARYTGHEWNAICKPWSEASVRFVLAYPDTYEVGMSNLGLHILYDAVNRHSDALCERAFAPWPDMEATMRAQGIPLYALESRRPLSDFDVIGFSLPYELNLTNVLNMLDLARLPIHAADRDDNTPLIIAGGSGAYHPEPMAPFIDAFVVGEGEEALLEVLQAFDTARHERATKHKVLRELARVPGVYVPSLYRVTYDDKGRLAAIEPTVPEAQLPVIKRTVDPLPPVPTCPIVPYVQPVHDRAMIEIMRGCTQGCRFCQAGMIYRPLRERSRAEIVQAAQEITRCTGYPEVGLISLSSADHSQIRGILEDLLAPGKSSSGNLPAGNLPTPSGPPLSVSLPSLRTDAFSVELAQLFARHSGLTFAPEAGSQRLRDVINKKVTEEDLIRAAEAAYANHWQRIKLYFMIGLPTETDHDIEAIVDLVQQVVEIGRRYHGRKANVSVTISTLVPKPHTPFQWHPLIDEATLQHRQEILKKGLLGPATRRQVRLSYHDARVSLLEAIIARGDRRLAPVIEGAWRAGARFDAWNEQFRWDAWLSAADQGHPSDGTADPFMADARRERERNEVLPWDHISCGVSKDYLWREYERAASGQTTRDCRDGCTNCGAIEMLGCTGLPSMNSRSGEQE